MQQSLFDDKNLYPATGHNTEYTEAIKGILLNGTDLHDTAAESSDANSMFTIVPTENTLWKLFNSSKDANSTNPHRIDYFFYAESYDKTMTVQSVDYVRVKVSAIDC